MGAQNVALYDDSVVHEIAVTFDQAAYDAMIATYASSREKDWIEATVTIDGVTLGKAGMRLKGTSSLGGLTSRTAGAGRAPVGGATGGNAAEQPQSLPWLVRLDKYVEGQSYQGHTEIVIRGNRSQTSLNEAVALELTALAGLATQEAFATRFSVNGGPKVLRLAMEHPNDEWQEATFEGDGILYKAKSSGDYSYRGEDPEAYDEVFDQEIDTDDENLAPLIDFLDFLNNSTDAAFAAELGRHLDVDAFARYLALQELLGNWDDIDGPGNNSYLRYDEETKRFTVLSWDLNLAFGGGGPSGAGPGGGPSGAGGPVIRTFPAGGGPAPADVGVARAGGPGPGGPGGRSNVLVQRFQANAAFAALYTKAKADLTAELLTSGKGAAVLDRWAGMLTTHAADLVDPGTIAAEADAIRQQLD